VYPATCIIHQLSPIYRLLLDPRSTGADQTPSAQVLHVLILLNLIFNSLIRIDGTSQLNGYCSLMFSMHVFYFFIKVKNMFLYIHLYSSNSMIAKEREKSETIKLRRLQRTHSIELIHAMTVMCEGSITRKILRLEFLHTFSP